jgi:RecA-family ATPase
MEATSHSIPALAEEIFTLAVGPQALLNQAVGNLPAAREESGADGDRHATEEPTPAAESEDETPFEGLICLDDVEVETIDWLWPSRIAIGKLTVLAGDPGLGKSTLSLDIAARVTHGRAWPDQTEGGNAAGSVILLSGEDGLADTTKPRLITAGANLRKVHAIDSVPRGKGKSGPFNLRTDIPWLGRILASLGDARLVIIDPVSCYLGETDDNKNGAVRALLSPLVEMAERCRVAVLLVTHLNKAAGGKSAYRLMGSLAYSAAARAVWMIALDPQDKDRVLMLQSKNNLAPRTSALAYRIKEGKLQWEADTIDMTADDLLAAEANDEAPTSEKGRAATFLRDMLASGPITSKEIEERAAAEGISKRTLDRAKSKLQVKSRRIIEDDTPVWYWRLPDPATTSVPDGQRPEDGNVGSLGSRPHSDDPKSPEAPTVTF